MVKNTYRAQTAGNMYGGILGIGLSVDDNPYRYELLHGKTVAYSHTLIETDHFGEKAIKRLLTIDSLR